VTAHDPIFALLAAEARTSERIDNAKTRSAEDKARAQWHRTFDSMGECTPTTHAGMAALLLHASEWLVDCTEADDDHWEIRAIRNVARALQGARATPQGQHLPANVVPLFRAVAAPPDLPA
jgi:hypothetical protein